MSTNFLKITAISELQEKNGSTFRKISLKPTTDVGGMKIYSARKAYTRTCFGAGKDKQGNVLPADDLFLQIQSGEIKVGDGLMGKSYNFKTTPYKPGDSESEVTTFSMVIFDHENPLKTANRALKANSASVVIEDGEVTAPEQLSSSNS